MKHKIGELVLYKKDDHPPSIGTIINIREYPDTSFYTISWNPDVKKYNIYGQGEVSHINEAAVTRYRENYLKEFGEE